jgi:hypothetical protein
LEKLSTSTKKKQVGIDAKLLSKTKLIEKKMVEAALPKPKQK